MDHETLAVRAWDVPVAIAKSTTTRRAIVTAGVNEPDPFRVVSLFGAVALPSVHRWGIAADANDWHHCARIHWAQATFCSKIEYLWPAP